MQQVVRSMKIAAHVLRLRLLLLLLNQEACVCELMEVFGLKQSDLSYHLIALQRAGFVHRERRGKYSYYGVNTKEPNTVNAGLLQSLVRWLGHDRTITRDRKTLMRVQRRCGDSCQCFMNGITTTERLPDERESKDRRRWSRSNGQAGRRQTIR